jgi:protein-disulfide isomerase
MLAKAALAAYRQNQFESMHTWLMTKGYESDRGEILEHVTKMGMDLKKFIADLDGEELEKVFDHTIGLALKMNVRSVPAILVGDYLSRESLDQKEFMKLLAKAHEENGTSSSQGCALPAAGS